MVAFAVSAADPRWNWRRIAAHSGTFAIHCAAFALLALPALPQLPKPHVADVQPFWVEVKAAEPVAVQPADPDPPKPHIKRDTQTPVSKPDIPIVDAVSMQQVAVQVSVPTVEPSGPDTKPSAPLTNQTLAYASVTTPRYPPISAREREQGIVTLRVLVNVAGEPERIEIERTSGHPRLDAAARESVAKWRFRPVLQNGSPMAAWGLVPVEFRLDRG